MKPLILFFIWLLFCSNANAQIPQYIHWNVAPNSYNTHANHPLGDTVYTGVQQIVIINHGFQIYNPTQPLTVKRIYIRSFDTINYTVFSGFKVRVLPMTSQGGYMGTNIPFITGLSTVRNSDTFTVNNKLPGDWIAIDLDTPFILNNFNFSQACFFVYEITHDGFTGDGIKLCIFAYTSTSHQTLFGNAPYIIGDKSPTYPMHFGFDVEPDWDAGLVSFISPPANDSFCSSLNPITVVVHNAGLQDIDSVRISWEANGVPQGTYYHTNNMPTNTYDTVTIGWYNFPNGIPVNLKAYTSHPQGTSDVFNTNDTIQESYTGSHYFSGD